MFGYPGETLALVVQILYTSNCLRHARVLAFIEEINLAQLHAILTSVTVDVKVFENFHSDLGISHLSA